MAFRFPLQRLLDLRELREQALARELVEAQAVARAEREVRDVLAAATDAAKETIAQETAGAPTAGHLTALGQALDQLNRHLRVAESRAVAADAAAQEQQKALTSAAKERRVLGRLRDRRLDAYRGGEALKDQRTMDDVALTQFTQKQDSNDEEDR
ncbi:MAG: flagellar export protein FliJ [Gemmatimonadota bacterium]